VAFTQKRIDLQLSLQNGNFEGGGNSATLSGLRVSAKIANAGAPGMGVAEISVYGMPLQMMNQLSAVGTQYNVQGQNAVTVLAGDADSVLPTVFQGTIYAAWVDAAAMPEVNFRLMAYAGLYGAVQPAQPTSFSSTSIDVAGAMQTLAGQMGLSFENSGVTTKLASCYLWGSPREQVKDIADQAGIQWTIDNNTLAIWPTGQTRSGTVIVSPETGMIGYPTFSQSNVNIRTRFNPDLKIGSKVTVQSSLTPACGDWVVINVNHDIEAQVPHGKWQSSFQASTLGGY